MSETVSFLAVGDTSPYVEPPESIFDGVANYIGQADIAFAQVERTFSDRGTYQEGSLSPHTRVSPRLMNAYSAVGFNVVGVASNHVMDWGPDAVTDTVAGFRKLGIQTIGAGAEISEARRPARFECKGVRVALLGYCSVLLPQYWATEERAGAAPLRASTYYLPYEYQPGSPARIVTEPYKEDIEAMEADIRAARQDADVVIASFHWGVHWVPRYIADYQITGAHAAIDAGCDLVFGHHPHLLKGIEIYKGKACVYSLGNLGMSRSPGALNYCLPNGEFTFSQVYDTEWGPNLSYSHRDHGNMTVLLEASLSRNGIDEVRLRPAIVDDYPRAWVAEPGSADFERVADFLKWSSAGFDTAFKRDGGCLVVGE